MSPKEKDRYLRPRPKNLSSSKQCLMAAGHSSNPGLFWWQSSGTNRRLLISLICSLTQRSYSRDTSPPLNGHAFGKQRFHNILLCCAEDPSYTQHHPFTDSHSLFDISNTSCSPRETCQRCPSWQGWVLSRLELPLSPWLTSPL